MRQVEAIGQSRFGQGISYTFAVMPSGRVYEGTGAGRLGAHTGGRNSRSHAIVLVGNYDSVVPSDAVLNGVAELVRYGHGRRWWTNARLSGGHRDVKSTGCPGNQAYRLIGEINRRAASGQTTPHVHVETVTPPAPKPPPPRPVIEEDEMIVLLLKDTPHRFALSGGEVRWIDGDTSAGLQPKITEGKIVMVPATERFIKSWNLNDEATIAKLDEIAGELRK